MERRSTRNGGRFTNACRAGSIGSLASIWAPLLAGAARGVTADWRPPARAVDPLTAWLALEYWKPSLAALRALWTTSPRIRGQRESQVTLSVFAGVRPQGPKLDASANPSRPRQTDAELRLDTGQGRVVGAVFELSLDTRKRRPIPNEVRDQRHPASMAAAKNMHAQNGIICRSLDSTYNCMGMVFAGRRTWVDPEHFDLIVTDDSYRKLATGERVVAGDVIAYRGKNNEVTHVGAVVEVRPTATPNPPIGAGLMILSQWGADGEYLHEGHMLPRALAGAGTPRFEIWTDRK